MVYNNLIEKRISLHLASDKYIKLSGNETYDQRMLSYMPHVGWTSRGLNMVIL